MRPCASAGISRTIRPNADQPPNHLLRRIPARPADDQLRYRGRARRLRPKSSAVLLYLAEHPNRLVTREELLRDVWPDTTVSPTVLRVCIREIRVALGEEADRFLTTVPRRGYRFTIDPADTGTTPSIFVGRPSLLVTMLELSSFRVAVLAVTVPPVLVKLSLTITFVPVTSKLPDVKEAPPESVISLFLNVNCPELDINPLTAILGVFGKSSPRLSSETTAVSVLLKSIFRIL